MADKTDSEIKNDSAPTQLANMSAEPKFTQVNLALDHLRIDGNTQSRAGINWNVVETYAERLVAGDQFPPVDVYFDEHQYWLADGFHRVEAARRVQYTAFPARVFHGSRREAQLHSIQSNITHGLQRSDADKRMVVLMLLQDDEWCHQSNYEIARYSAISVSFVRKIKQEIDQLVSSLHPVQDRKLQERYSGAAAEVLALVAQKLRVQPAEKVVRRGGKTYRINTSKIGKTKLTDQLEQVYPQAKQISETGVKVVKTALPKAETPVFESLCQPESPEILPPEQLAAQLKQAYSVSELIELCACLIGSENASLFAAVRSRLRERTAGSAL
ncbi:MAG: ParB N-terminal domain-containing protein [Acidobacteria bacterium]|nr:ParB N-terminal domain-containing protein [Acidobacteriota bacterium]